ncbi:hypothetical protein F7430_22740 [Salmonella enterica]|nr:hypothetical protein [Salmonella enterica]
MTNSNESRAFKVAITFIVIFCVVHALHMEQASWPLITGMVLMIPATDHRHLLRRAGERVLGTVCGAALGILALHIEKTYGFYAMLPIAALGAGIGGYYARSRFPYAAIIFCVTMAVVFNAPAGDLHRAFERVFGVLLGVVLSSIMGILLRI